MEPRPVSEYGRSKLEAERAVRAHVPDAIILRPPVVYGPRDTGVLEIFKPLAKGTALQISGGERWFSIIYVKDLVCGILSALGSPQAAGQTYFLTNAQPASWSELTTLTCQILSRQARVIRIPQLLAYAVGSAGDLIALLTGKPGILSRDKIREACCRYWTCDSGKAARELDFRAATPIEEGLAETLTWYKEAGWLPA
jgi:nucleoside-diphosphate-sugar epimerase